MRFGTTTSLLTILVYSCYAAENCVELQHENNGTLTNGTYVVQHAGQTLTVYCLYYHGYGYTFISTTASGGIDMSAFYDTSDHVIIRHTRTNGVQYESRLEQIATFSDTPVSVQFNTNDYYQGPINFDMEPYIFVGFIPKEFTEQDSVQGWSVNGQELTFSNCDANPNSYFTLFFNENNAAYTSESGTQEVTGDLMSAWYNTATQVPVVEELPDEFYTPYYEVHHGGCGGYGIGTSYAEVTGVAVGVRFGITCVPPADVLYASFVAGADTDMGSHVTYTCDAGYDVISGDVNRICTSTGVWSGQLPVCGVNGGMSEWTVWSECTVTCGTGQTSRSRTCTNPVPILGAPCEGDLSETDTCNTTPCPIDGGWIDWSDWGECSTTCGGGATTRSRTCTNPQPQYNGADCQGDPEESDACNVESCPVDGGWIDWSDWGECSTTCGGGSTSRSRTCTNPQPQYNGADCQGDPEESDVCNEDPCPVDGGWSYWSDWSVCPVECGGGVTMATRTCTEPTPQHNGADCQGDQEKTDTCNTHPCPINARMGDWSAWSECTLSCGTGEGTRQRLCLSPQQYGGVPCGTLEESVPCNTNECPVNGNWGSWSQGSCSVTCGYGSRSMTRSCDNPAPAHGGLDCSGISTETEDCSDQLCTGKNQCGSDYFTCKSGTIKCISDYFRCDCEDDCDDGSDEDITWAGCDKKCSAAVTLYAGSLVIVCGLISHVINRIF